MPNYPAIPAQSYITAATHTYSGTLTGGGGGGAGGAGYTFNTGAAAVQVSGNLNVDGDVIISGRSSLSDRIAAIEERLCLLVPDFEKMEHFPALKKAYEHYLLIEKLCRKESSSE